MQQIFFGRINKKRLCNKIATRLLLLLLLVTSIFLSTINAQTSKIKGLDIGDKIPDVALTMINYPKQRINLSEFKGKAIILDFWATWCSPCVGSFPKLDSLQKEFTNDLQIILVTKEGEKIVNLLFEKMNDTKVQLPSSVIKDSDLSKLFPHNELPHYIWIDKSGIVKAITGGEQIVSDNIRLFIKDDSFNLPVKKDAFTKVNYYKPVFLDSPQVLINQEDILFKKEGKYKSVFLKYNKDIPRGMYYDKNRIICNNVSIINLYMVAFGKRKPAFLSGSRVILRVKDSAIFTPTSMGNMKEFSVWKEKNYYNYEIIVPVERDAHSAEGLKYMQRDLNEYFGHLGIYGTMDTIKIKCYILSKIPGATISSNGGKPSVEKNAFFYKLTNSPISTFINDLSSYYWQLSKLALINETGLMESIDLEIDAKMSSIDEVGKALEKYGLKLKESEREVEMIVITQN